MSFLPLHRLADLLPLVEEPVGPQAVTLISRELLAGVIKTGLPIPARICDAYFTRDGDVLLLMEGNFPSDWVMFTCKRTESGEVHFVGWEIAYR